jgi:hypothetical protein
MDSQHGSFERKLVTKVEIARRYSVVPRTIDNWMPWLPHVKIGKKLVRFDPIECDQAVEKFKVESEVP